MKNQTLAIIAGFSMLFMLGNIANVSAQEQRNVLGQTVTNNSIMNYAQPLAPRNFTDFLIYNDSPTANEKFQTFVEGTYSADIVANINVLTSDAPISNIQRRLAVGGWYTELGRKLSSAIQVTQAEKLAQLNEKEMAEAIELIDVLASRALIQNVRTEMEIPVSAAHADGREWYALIIVHSCIIPNSVEIDNFITQESNQNSAFAFAQERQAPILEYQNDAISIIGAVDVVLDADTRLQKILDFFENL